MFIKLLGENENGFPEGCTVGKVYKVREVEGYTQFEDDDGEWNYAFDKEKEYCNGNWQVVDKKGNVL